MDGVDQRRVQHGMRVGNADANADLLLWRRLWRVYTGCVPGVEHAAGWRLQRRSGGGVDRVGQHGDVQPTVRGWYGAPDADVHRQLLRDVCGECDADSHVQHAGMRLMDGMGRNVMQQCMWFRNHN